jgi:hypothetical protein
MIVATRATSAAIAPRTIEVTRTAIQTGTAIDVAATRTIATTMSASASVNATGPSDWRLKTQGDYTE